jgi:hypothetical protein
MLIVLLPNGNTFVCQSKYFLFKSADSELLFLAAALALILLLLLAKKMCVKQECF